MISGPLSSRLGVLACAGFLFAVTIAIASPAEGAAKRRVGVSVNGTPAGPIRGAISAVLKKHGFVAAAIELSGDSEDAISSAAKAGKLSAVIVGEVRDGGKRAKLRVYSSSGDLIGEGSWSEKKGAKKLGATVKRTLWARVGGPLSKARPPAAGGGEKAEPAAAAPAEPEEKPAEPASTYSRSKDSAAQPAEDDGEKKAATKKKRGQDKDDDKDEEKADKAEKARPSEPADTSPQAAAAGPALEILVGPRFVGRTLSWQQPGMPGNPNPLNPYSLGLAPAVGGSIAWYPAAHFRGGWLSNLGLAFSAEYVPGVTSQAADGAKYPTQLSDYSGGLRGRMAYGPVRGALTLGGGQHAMIFRSGTAADGTPAPRSSLTNTPDVKYLYARVGLDVRVALPANLSLLLGGGYRYVLSAGDVNYLLETEMFLPSAKFVAFDAGASLGYRILPMLEARAGFDLRYYKITPGTNTHMVTGGSDQYTAVWAALVVTLDGATGSATSAPAGKKKADKDADTEE